jgi:hypothetical protein
MKTEPYHCRTVANSQAAGGVGRVGVVRAYYDASVYGVAHA